MKIAIAGALCIALLTAIFAVQNAQQTQVVFMGWYFEAPLVMVLILTFAAGAATGALAMLPGTLRKSMELSRLRAAVPATEAAHHPNGTDGTEGVSEQ